MTKHSSKHPLLRKFLDTVHPFSGEDGEDRFIEFIRDVLANTQVDPEEIPVLMDRCYREEFHLPMDLVYAQFLGRGTDGSFELINNQLPITKEVN